MLCENARGYRGSSVCGLRYYAPEKHQPRVVCRALFCFRANERRIDPLGGSVLLSRDAWVPTISPYCSMFSFSSASSVPCLRTTTANVTKTTNYTCVDPFHHNVRSIMGVAALFHRKRGRCDFKLQRLVQAYYNDERVNHNAPPSAMRGITSSAPVPPSVYVTTASAHIVLQPYTILMERAQRYRIGWSETKSREENTTTKTDKTNSRQ